MDTDAMTARFLPLNLIYDVELYAKKLPYSIYPNSWPVEKL